ncbi:MAG: MFS transporter [Bryobacteraceae bacterium]|nr:MFS transporter [Bryobacteraceae bacterium]
MVIAYIDRSNLSVAITLPEFRSHFQIADQERGSLLAAFFWSYALLQIPAGWIIDRFGVKKPFAIGFLVWSATSACTAFATSLQQLYFLRILLGVAEAVAPTASMRWIRFNYPDQQRGFATGIWMLGTKIGPAVGPPVAAALTAAFGWRQMFFFLGLGLLVWIIPWLRYGSDTSLPARDEAVDSSEPPFSKVLFSPTVAGVFIGTFCYMYFVYFCVTWLPSYLVEQRNLSLASMGFYSFFAFGGMAAATVAGGWTADRMIKRGADSIRVRKLFTMAGLLIASTEVIGALTDSTSVALFAAVFSLTGLGLAGANKWALTQSAIPPASVGRVLGIQNCAANVAGIAAPLFTGWLKHATGSYSAPLFAVWAFLLIGCAAFWVLVRPLDGCAPQKLLAE